MDDLIERLRLLEQDHEPDGWPAVLMRDITALLDALEAAREDAERLDWLSQLDVGISHLGHGDYQWYGYANPKPESGMLGLRAAIDHARRKEARNG